MIVTNPPKVILGSSSISCVGDELARVGAQTVLILCGRFHLRNPKRFKAVRESLEKLHLNSFVCTDVSPNTCWEEASKIIRFAKEHQVDTVLAIGGGSVIDMAKAVALGVPAKVDVFDFYERKAVAKTALKVIAVPTLVGTGSEGSDGGVLTRERRKLSYGAEFGVPLVAILDPDLLSDLDKSALLCGMGDASSHVLERYFCKRDGQLMDLADEFLLVICRTLINQIRKLALEDRYPTIGDLEQIMWACHLAHNGYLSIGKRGDWATHTIAHELETASGRKHGHTVGLVFPFWIDEIYQIHKLKCDRLIDVLGSDLDLFEPVHGSRLESKTARLVQRLYKACGAPVRLWDLGISGESVSSLAKAISTTTKSGTIGNLEWLTELQVTNILNKML